MGDLDVVDNLDAVLILDHPHQERLRQGRRCCAVEGDQASLDRLLGGGVGRGGDGDEGGEVVDWHSAEGGQIALAVLRVASESRIRSRRRTIQEPRPDDDITGEVLGDQVENLSLLLPLSLLILNGPGDLGRWRSNTNTYNYTNTN